MDRHGYSNRSAVLRRVERCVKQLEERAVNDAAKYDYAETVFEKSSMHKPTLVFADLHAPFTHPGYLPFLRDTAEIYDVDETVICLGDMVDHHALSRHQTETCADSAYAELAKAKKIVGEYFNAFPKGKLCSSNHDDIIERQAATVGIGPAFLRTFRELYEVPSGWEIDDEFIIDNVLYKHGENCGGKDGALNTAIEQGMSTCIGHYHANFGVKGIANARKLIFGMAAGCGIDIKAYAFAYGKHARHRPILACGIVFSDTFAITIPMSPQYFRSYR